MIVPSSDLCFYFPYLEDSGVPVLFARMANTLAEKHPGIKVYVIDYINGSIARNIKSLENIILIPYTDDTVTSPPEDAILIMQSFVPYHWPESLAVSPKTRIFFWNLHPKNFIPSLLPITKLRDITFNNFSLYKFIGLFFPFLMRRLRSFVHLLLAHKALAFMDQPNFDMTKKYLFIKNFEPVFIPVPATPPLQTVIKDLKKVDKDHLNYCWVGRICDFKAHILLYTANKLAKAAYDSGSDITFHIIGDGPDKDYVLSNIIENEKFKIKYAGALPHSELDQYLLDHVDVVAAMGTSALEAAKLGIPTILLDFSYKPIDKDYVFRWLHQTVNYDLGHVISDADSNQNNESLKNMVVSLQKNYEIESEKSLKYFTEHHSIEKVSEKFFHQVNESDLEFDLINPSLLRKPAILEYYYKIRK
jgi:glycosyltransferase involved in cell wall biosynthesis